MTSRIPWVVRNRGSWRWLAIAHWQPFAVMIISLALLGQAVPGFVLAPILILILAVSLRALPVSGTGSVEHLIMPALVVGAVIALPLRGVFRAPGPPMALSHMPARSSCESCPNIA